MNVCRANYDIAATSEHFDEFDLKYLDRWNQLCEKIFDKYFAGQVVVVKYRQNKLARGTAHKPRPICHLACFDTQLTNKKMRTYR